MSFGKVMLCALFTLGSGSVLMAADVPSTQPAGVTKPARPKHLTQPWSLIKTLTPEQTAQIEKIHSDSADQIKKLQAKEKDDITALLSPEQQTELKVAEAKHKAELVEHRKEPTTAPVK